MAMVDLKSPAGTVSGYLAIPKKGYGPGVLVLHAWWGLNDFFKGLCDRLATDGFVAFAPDVYRGATASTRDGAENLMSKVDQTAAERDIRSGLRGLQSHPGVRGTNNSIPDNAIVRGERRRLRFEPAQSAPPLAEILGRCLSPSRAS